MEDAVHKTQRLLRIDLPIDDLVPNTHNPNEMTEEAFNLLYDNIDRMGITDPILVRHHPEQEGKYRIVGGHHRWEVAKLHGFDEVPCTVIEDADFDEDMEKFQLVRHNIIKGKMSPQKFMELYQSLEGKYSEEVAADLFGFEDEEAFRKLVQSTAKALPPEMKESFLDAAKEVRTINDLAQVLNRLFSTYGDTVPYGYMIFDFGGQDHVWLRMAKNQKKHMHEFGDWCRKQNRTMDGVLSSVLQLIAQGKMDMDTLAKEVAKQPEVTLSHVAEGELPTEDYLSTLDAMQEL